MQKIIIILILLTLQATVYGQNLTTDKDSVVKDTLPITADSLNIGKDSTQLTVDSLELKRKPKSIVDAPIEYQCKDSMLISFDDKRVFLYGTADVQTGSMKLTSEYMRMEMESSSIFAEGRFDSTKNELVGTPVFKDNKDEFEARTIKYNFKTNEGFVNDVVTQQQNGYLFGEITKMHSNKEIHLKNGRYTTCDLDHPHFYLELTRAKVIPNDKIVSGPAYFVLLDVPVYILGLPFGIFPSSHKHRSGILIPTYGEESRRGFYLENGGYYFWMGEYCDLKLTGSYYTYGSWGATASSKFKVRYKFSGSLDFSYTKNVFGEKEFIKSNNSDIKYSSTNSYLLRFSFNQDPKANPTSSFSANISYDKQNYDKYNATSVQDYAKSTTSSSVSYQKSMFGGFANLSASANMTQNLYDSTLSFTAPTVAFSLQKFYPFKRKHQIGSAKWYEKIGASLSMNFNNSVPTIADSLLFKQEMFDQMKYGLTYKVPVSTSFNILKYITVTPSISYTGRVSPNYFQRYATNTYDLATETYKYSYSTDTINELKHIFDFTTSISASTKLYGMFQFNKAKHIKAFRHVLTPTLGLSWHPDWSDEMWHIFDIDPTDPTGNKKYSMFSGTQVGSPSGGKSGNINFGLGNNFEMKVKTKKDTVDGEYTKIKLLESLNFSGSYNMAADSCKLSNISMSGSTRLFDKMTLNFSGSFDPYQLDSAGNRTRFYLMKETGGKQWARLTSARLSTGFSLDSKTLGKKKKEEKEKAANEYGQEDYQAEVDEDGNIIATAEEVENRKKNESKLSKKERDGEFDYYSCPWSLSVDYGFNYSHPGIKSPVITQTLNFSGNITFTEKWRMSLSSGYDFDAKKMTSTRISVTRDLHCFNLSFYIIPFGILKSYNFTLAINSSLFNGVEYKRSQSWRDN
ncbi:MAG: LPS-assembly protein LptD [Bacteroidales bacterium]|nr:LPS-assembly protein LptD [Bacteroidales bacterium]